MMLIAFSTIYFITYSNVRVGIKMELSKALDHKPVAFKKDSKFNFTDSVQPNNSPKSTAPRKNLLDFTVTIDTNGNLIDSDSIFVLDETFIKAVLAKKNKEGTIILDDNNWAYLKIPEGNGYKIAFVDITKQQETLNKLIYTFLILAPIMLIVIFLISKFFADSSIIPIKEAFEKQKQFIGDASHELKTPLAVISTNVDVLLSNSDDTIRHQSKWLHYIKSETERMNKLTNDLLYLAQVDYSEAKMIFSQFNLSEAVENILLTMEAVIFEKNLSFQYNIEPNLKIFGNTEQLKQVVMILLDNAIKYTNAKGTIDLSLIHHSNNILLSVKNSGEGISEEHLEKIFDRFYRTDKSRARKSGGYGLGLAIAKAIVEEHKGKINVKSILNESTTFTVELPYIS
jgi:signal transduction histidine kinase